MVAPDSQAPACPLSGRNSTYRPVKKSGTGSEPLHQFIPLVEFAFDSPRGEKTAATVNPGLAYVGSAWQVAAEAIIPLNSEGGRAIGVRAHVFLFLDDLMPALFGKPLLGR
jgi:hypothetical protein